MKVDKHKVIRKLLKTNTPVILEVGSHYGEDSLKFLKSFPKAELYCFEPDPRNTHIMRKYANDNRIHLSEVALSDSDCDEVDFYLSHLADFDKEKMFNKYHWIPRREYLELKLNRSGASSLKHNSSIDCLDVVKVRTAKLDSWMKDRQIEQIDLLWIDVQGAEREVIEGARESLCKTRYVWIEYGEQAYEGGMNRKETIRILKPMFSTMWRYSRWSDKGDLLFRNKRI